MLGINEVVGSIRRGELPPLQEKSSNSKDLGFFYA
jgi:hypothetical protein